MKFLATVECLFLMLTLASVQCCPQPAAQARGVRSACPDCAGGCCAANVDKASGQKFWPFTPSPAPAPTPAPVIVAPLPPACAPGACTEPDTVEATVSAEVRRPAAKAAVCVAKAGKAAVSVVASIAAAPARAVAKIIANRPKPLAALVARWRSRRGG
jgi:hypothetical protein